MDGGGPRVRLSLPAEATSVPAARHAVRAWLAEVDQTHLIDDVELAVTEVVTNALVHAATRVEVGARLDRDTEPATVRVEVADGSSHLPRPREAGSSSGTGRGLRLLDQTVTRWGAERRPVDQGGGKVVWFELGVVDGGVDDGARDGGAPDRPSSDLRIVLLDVPLLLMTAWKEHTATLLREHLLVQLELDDVEAVLERHAAAGEVLSLLDEQWPELHRHRDPHALLAASVEPAVTASRLMLVVPQSAVRSFAVLDEVITHALVLADSGALLTAPTQPEMRAMRHWLVSEVLRQADGEPPRPHVLGSGDLEGPWLEPAWDASTVDGSAVSCLAADGENRIVAVSDPALRFLGYDRGLVGQRLLRLIPPRFQQAHLAGFSLHLVNDRGPLIGVPIVVPVVCADGQERMAELLIRPERSGQGRSVYVADLRPV